MHPAVMSALRQICTVPVCKSMLFTNVIILQKCSAFLKFHESYYHSTLWCEWLTGIISLYDK